MSRVCAITGKGPQLQVKDLYQEINVLTLCVLHVVDGM